MGYTDSVPFPPGIWNIKSPSQQDYFATEKTTVADYFRTSRRKPSVLVAAVIRGNKRHTVEVSAEALNYFYLSYGSFDTVKFRLRLDAVFAV